MPILSVDYSRGAASALYLSDNLTYKIGRFFMAAPYISYGNKPSKKEILLNLISGVEKRFGVKIDKKVKVYVSSLYHYELGIENTVFCDKNEAFRSLYPLDFLYFSHLHVGDNTGVYSGMADYPALLKEVFFDEKEETLMNYFENLNLYPFLVPSSDRDSYEEIAYLKQVARAHCRGYDKGKLDETKTLILSTTREVSNERAMARFMLLCVESLCSEGIYDFRLDYSNFLGSTAALSLLENKIFQQIEMPEFVELGSVIVVEDDLNCTFSIEKGPKQELKLPRNSLFTIPLTSFQKVDFVASSKKRGSIEKSLNGGVFGVVIDTRNREFELPHTLGQKKDLEREWEDTLLTGFRSL